MDPRKIKDEYHVCFHKLLKLPESRSVILILNFTCLHVITFTNCGICYMDKYIDFNLFI